MRIRVDFACNDPDNGLFDGRAEMVQIGDLIELTARRAAPTFRVLDDGTISLAGKRWPISRSKDWVGNWCWNGYWLSAADAAAFLIWLHGRGLFHCDQAETRLFNAWRREALTDNDRKLIGRLIEKAAA